MNGSALWRSEEKTRSLVGFGPDSTTANYGGPMVAAVYLMRQDGAALLQLRDEKPGLRHAGLWVPPGGHVDSGETLAAAAVREFSEETKIDCENVTWSGAHEVVLPPWPTFILANFWSRYDGCQQHECMEGQQLEFVERQRAPELAMPAFVVKIWDLVISNMQTLENRI